MHRNMRRGRVGVALAASLLLTSGNGYPQTTAHRCEKNAASSALAEQGYRLSKDGQLDAALKIYRAAYAECQDPRLFYNMARLLHRLGNYAEAVDYYERFLSSKDETDPERLIQAKVYLLEARQAMNRPIQSPPSPPPPSPPPPSSPSVTEESPHKSSSRPPGPAIALLVGGGALLATGIGLGTSTLYASRALVQGDGNFDNALYERAKLTNSLGIAFDVIGGAALTSGLVWTLVWAAQRTKKAQGSTPAAVSFLLAPSRS